ncbi:NADH:ubiquinone oxidoreductase, NADH-binding (51 kD) subunit [Caldisphaera lagunensis DSM 15908]|uniref:NADH:ubiquinone oxidoreductase, NADH-binding (51 kD) subunit n=1 Tax=Caldisphaera lagunensis (strain DSM 15908 / JCM 11604 / ANMR 0165 / IC-154) TaxID=1056495 RepID=L0ACY9_CALLD|nr:NADH-ubiquinone oxidoreductase-F iron-sulfur binding region domain-containing protein [Caldisphaera lagunensis]AFZ70920.1 NADH:ubiquinone oxidoreductase, NADH-binding (51 kD) subunit [Caldisphaera lagunensis DSM 15908]
MVSLPQILIKRPEVDSFYTFSTVELPEQYCRGLACFASRSLNEKIFSKSKVQIPRTYCLGFCYAGPSYSKGYYKRPIIDIKTKKSVLLKDIVKDRIYDIEQYISLDGLSALKKALNMEPIDIIKEVKESGLRGRGGAYFPTGLKWESAYNQREEERYLIINGDEGDAGAYIDKVLMEDNPYLVIEGALIAAYAIGAKTIYIYVRKEYPFAYETMKKAINEFKNKGLIGTNALKGRSINIILEKGKGSYVVGEETAMINAIMGLRGEPRARPPYPTELGLFNKPTVVNNVETISNIPWIIKNSGKSYYELGFNKSRGTKLISLNNLFNKPGVYEVEFGISLNEIVYNIGDGLKNNLPLKMLIIGGPLAGPILPNELDTKLGVEELRNINASLGHGNIIAFSNDTTAFDLLYEIIDFAAYESCGKCFPCRFGTQSLLSIVENAKKRGYFTKEESNSIERIARVMKSQSLCGHGVGTGDAVLSIINKLRDEVVK